jgi:hypothetical protein
VNIDEELKHLPTLESVGRALAQFARSLHPSGDFKLRGRKWVYAPPKFVTFSLVYKRKKNISLSLRGNPTEFEEKDVLPLRPGRGANNSRGGCSECQITDAKQLSAAASYIERAHIISRRGRNRMPKTPVTIEEKVKVATAPPPSADAFRAKLEQLRTKNREAK